MTHEVPDPETFIAAYGPNAAVAFPNGMSMRLEQAVGFEAVSCTATSPDRQDPEKRTRFLARILAAGGSLRPEDEALLREPE